ncbi:MAG: hypothetical protein COB37_06395 [Kordiimonadales bacterium]|nr:MAG: hypothetical protein COB37_06395 [Kordiimonadales bacterium]
MNGHVPSANQAIARAISCAAEGDIQEAIRLYSLVPAHSQYYQKAQKAKEELETLAAPIRPLALSQPLPQETKDTLLSLACSGHNQEAIRQVNIELSSRPNDAYLYTFRADVQLALKDFGAAAESAKRALSHQPNFVKAYMVRGLALLRLGHLNQAISCFSNALDVDEACFGAHFRLGNCYKELHRYEKAISHYQRAIEINAGTANLHYNLGNAHLALDQLDQAEACYTTALQINPDHVNARLHIGLVYKEKNDPASAISCYNQVLKINPNSFEAYCNLGTAHRSLNQLDTAVSSYLSALNINPNHAETHNLLGITYEVMGQLEDALACFGAAAELKPNFPHALYNAALIHLLKGDLKEGWRLYEHRFHAQKGPNAAYETPHKSPRWTGQDLAGKTIMLTAEQGLGDQIQFVRYARNLHAMEATVLLECSAVLVPLFKSLRHIAQFVASSSTLPAADFHCPVNSLPGVLGDMLDQTLVHASPYISATDQRIFSWGERLEGIKGFRVGVSWQGKVTYKKDKLRSMALEEFTVFSRVHNVNLISLQKGEPGISQIPAFQEKCELYDVEDVTNGKSDLMDAAAVIMNLDLVITSCTSIAHLAGALGVQTWVMLSEKADWRWFLDRDDSPWYPSVRLFRQQKCGNWGPVFAKAADELKKLVKKSAGDIKANEQSALPTKKSTF